MNNSELLPKKLPKKGKLVLFKGPGEEFETRTFPIPPLEPGEVLVKNLYTTICGSDLHTYSGVRTEPCPTVLGHEIVGEILDIHSTHSGYDLRGKKLEMGDVITWSIFSSDPHSPNALVGIPQKGENLFKYGHALVSDCDAFHGGLADFCILKSNTEILKLPKDMPLPIASTLNCSVSTVAGALRMAGDIRDKHVLITGMGHLGITCVAMCRDAGAEWIGATDIESKRLEDAMAFGADEVFNMNCNNEELIKTLKSKLPQNGVDIVFDMSGSPEAMEFGIECLAIGGSAIWVGAVFNTRDLKINPEKIIRNLTTIKGLHNYNYADFKYAFDFMKRNWTRFPFYRIVESEFGLDQVQAAFDYALKFKPLRVGIRI